MARDRFTLIAKDTFQLIGVLAEGVWQQQIIFLKVVSRQCDQKKLPNVYKSCPKLISLENDRFLTPLQKLPKNVGDLGKLIVAKGFKKLPKVQ